MYYHTCECGHRAMQHDNLKKHWWNRDRAELFGKCYYTKLKEIKDDCDQDYCKHVSIRCKCKKFKYPEVI